MLFSVSAVICVSFGLVQTIPLPYKDPFETNYDYIDYSNILRPTRNLIPKPGAESLFLKLLGDNNQLQEANQYRENNFIKLPTLPSGDLVILPQNPYLEDRIQDTQAQDYDLISQNLSPFVWTKYMEAPYVADQDSNKADQALNTGSMSYEVNPYEVDLYPYIHTSLSAALNPVPPVHSLPPVYSTHIHETLPSLENRAAFDIDVLNPENSELMPPNLRITRTTNEDFLDELAHEAMMNNILPTMPIPFVRDAESSLSHQVTQSRPMSDPAMAVYPTSVPTGCSLPIFLGCSPNISRGATSKAYPNNVPAEVA